jgi:hypothetical protein
VLSFEGLHLIKAAAFNRHAEEAGKSKSLNRKVR